MGGVVENGFRIENYASMKKGRVFRAILPTPAKWSVKKKMKEKVMNGMGGF